MLKKLILALVALLVIFTPGVAFAGSPAAFTSDTTSPVVGHPVTFTADPTTDCLTNRCQWSWDFYNQYGQAKTGGQIGEGAAVVHTFSAFAATKPFIVVKLKVTAPGGTNNFTLAQHAYVVAAA